MKLSKQKEDYLKEIYKLQTKKNRSLKQAEIASKLKLSKPTTSEMVKKLETDGFLLIQEKRAVSLTKKGIKEARKVHRKHQLIEVFFNKLLNIKQKNKFHTEAHKMEHELSDEASDKLDDLLNNPDFCPDGNPIPDKNSTIIELNKLPINKAATILFAKTQDPQDLTRLSSLGIVPGTNVSIIKKISKGPIMLSVKESELALGSEICSKIYVELK
jgi:DtxR family transcriptional regulator, Mn-dependent transcriptional regulator